MNVYKTSVLMSVYYNEKAEYLNSSIESILINQTQRPDEFVLVCDGPLTLELDTVISNYKKLFPQIFAVYRLKENQGLGKALNFGLQKCKNEIIIRADSDDICDSNRIKLQYEYLLKHPDIAIVSSYIDEFDINWKMPKDRKEVPLTCDAIEKMAKFRNPINHMAVAFRKSAIISIGSYRHIPYVEDYELWVRAIINGYKLSNIDKVLVHARVGNGMIKRRGNRQYIQSWKKLSAYMFDNKMINKREYYRNMLAVRAFVFIPSGLKEYVYKRILRK